jgi:hypothetical protein
VRAKRGGAKAAEKRRVKPDAGHAPFGDQSNSLRRSAFSAALRLFRFGATAWFRPRTNGQRVAPFAGGAVRMW